MHLRDFIVVEFARAWQEERGAALVDPEVAESVRRGDLPDDDEARLLAYCRALLDARLADGADGRRAVEGLRGTLTAVGILLPVLGLLAGAATLRAALPPNDVRPVNILQFVGAGVVVPTLFFCLTTALATLGPRATAASHWVVWALSALRSRARDTHVGRLAGRVLRRSGVVAPLFAGLSHRFWIGAFTGFLGLALWRFASEDYLFAWSSTLPDFQVWMQRLTSVLAAVVPTIDAPSAEQIAVSEYGSLNAEWLASTGSEDLDERLRKGWWQLLLASSAILGLLPRLVGLVASSILVRRGIRRGLDTAGNRAVLAALQPSLSVSRLGDGAALPASPRRVVPEVPSEAHRHGLAVVPFAAPAPSRALLTAVGLDRLGLSDLVLEVPEDDDRAAMAAVTRRVGDGEHAPGGVVVVFDFAATPDRVREEFLQDVSRALPDARPVHVLLGGLERFRKSPRAAREGARKESWLAMAARAGVPEARVHVEP